MRAAVSLRAANGMREGEEGRWYWYFQRAMRASQKGCLWLVNDLSYVLLYIHVWRGMYRQICMVVLDLDLASLSQTA